uniref:Uncharacterized protein n=1 Tax=Timema monikensis TaxID=170555 RepID=A0A7R9ECT0_9NEOP|nr:unnamed protein product [Timema monikensis]
MDSLVLTDSSLLTTLKSYQTKLCIPTPNHMICKNTCLAAVSQHQRSHGATVEFLTKEFNMIAVAFLKDILKYLNALKIKLQWNGNRAGEDGKKDCLQTTDNAAPVFLMVCDKSREEKRARCRIGPRIPHVEPWQDARNSGVGLVRPRHNLDMFGKNLRCHTIAIDSIAGEGQKELLDKSPRSQLCLKVVCWGKKELLDKSPHSQLCLKGVCWGKKELLDKSPHSQLCLEGVCWGKKELLDKSPHSQLCLEGVCWGHLKYCSPMASLVLTDSSQLTSDSQHLGIYLHVDCLSDTPRKLTPLAAVRRVVISRASRRKSRGDSLRVRSVVNPRVDQTILPGQSPSTTSSHGETRYESVVWSILVLTKPYYPVSPPRPPLVTGKKELLAKSPRSQLCLKVVCWGKKELLAISPRSQLCMKVVCWGKKELLAKYPRSQLCKKELLAKSSRSRLCLKVVCWGKNGLLAKSPRSQLYTPNITSTACLMEKSFIFALFWLTVAKSPRSQLYLKIVCWGKKELLVKSIRSQLCLKVVYWGKRELLAKSPRSQLCLKVVCWGKTELLVKSPRSQLCLKVVCWDVGHRRPLHGIAPIGGSNEGQMTYDDMTYVTPNTLHIKYITEYTTTTRDLWRLPVRTKDDDVKTESSQKLTAAKDSTNEINTALV